MASKRKVVRIVLAVAAVLATMALLGMASVLHTRTFVDWWKPVAVCLPVALALGLPLKRPAAFLTDLSSGTINYLCGAVFGFALLSGGFYILNYYKADASSSLECVATVQRRYAEKHYRTKRISRNSVARGEEYLVYCVELEFPDGRTKKMEVPLSEYNRTRQGALVDVVVQDGFCGVPVMKEHTFRPRQRSARKHG